MNESILCAMVNEYVDDELSSDLRVAFEDHLIRCAECQDELERLLALQYQVVSLPRSIQPKRDLWSEIELSLKPEPGLLTTSIRKRKNGSARTLPRTGKGRVFYYVRAAAVLLIFLAGGTAWLLLRSPQEPGTDAASANSTAQEIPAGHSAEAPRPSGLTDAGRSLSPDRTPESIVKPVQVSNRNSAASRDGHTTRAEREMQMLEERLKRGLQLRTASVLPSSSGKVAGLVMDERGKPVQGIAVEIVGMRRTALTDEKGKFEFFGLPADAYTFQVNGIGYQRNAVNGVKIIPGFTTQVNFLVRSGSVALTDVAMNKEQLFAEVTTSASLDELPLASYARPSIQSNRLKVEGKVVDERGRSIVGAVVLVLGTKRGAYSDNEGKFHIYGVQPGTYTLQATATGYQARDTARVQVLSDFPVEVNIALDPSEGR